MSKKAKQKMLIANSDRPVVFYDLDVVISVGYRIKSERGVQFRRWATNVLRQHLVQGYCAESTLPGAFPMSRMADGRTLCSQQFSLDRLDACQFLWLLLDFPQIDGLLHA